MYTIGQFLCLMLVPTVGITGITIFILYTYKISLLYALIVPFCTFSLFYFLLPLVFMCSHKIQRYFVYLHKSKKPPEEFDYNDPESAGLSGCRNFHLFLDDNTQHIGVWHLLPHSLLPTSSSFSPSDFNESLRSSGKNIVIYFHGNTGCRALEHRKELYWLLQQLDSHILAFDYRGFGDSSPLLPSEESTVEDGLAVYKWVRTVVGGSGNIFIWGHSLGTGVSSHLVARLHEEEDFPTALILESPFTNIGEALRHNKKTILYKYIPALTSLFVRSLHRSGLKYETDVHIHQIQSPILILHAVDDETVPFSLGVKLYEKKKENSSGKGIYFKKFPKGHGHKLIHTSPQLPNLINQFMISATRSDWEGFDSHVE